MDPNHVGNLRSLLNYMGSKSNALRHLMDVMWEAQIIKSPGGRRHIIQDEEKNLRIAIIDEGDNWFDEHNNSLKSGSIRVLPAVLR